MNGKAEVPEVAWLDGRFTEPRGMHPPKEGHNRSWRGGGLRNDIKPIRLFSIKTE